MSIQFILRIIVNILIVTYFASEGEIQLAAVLAYLILWLELTTFALVNSIIQTNENSRFLHETSKMLIETAVLTMTLKKKIEAQNE